MASIQKFLVVFIIMTWLFFPVHVYARNKIFNIRHWAAPDHVRVVIDASDDIPYTVEKAENKLLIDFKNTETPEDLPSEIILTKPGVNKIEVIPLANGSVRVGLSVSDNVQTKVFHLARIPEKPYRVVVDVTFPDVEKQEGHEREQVKVLRKDKIIVIDPGHGGEDPGAIGKLRTQEKKVVLEISRKLRDILNQKKGYRAFLTRNGDYYVPFKKRMKIAREYGADLFISIHADAFRRRGARGSSAYCLSLRGASSEAAKILARNENLADIVGGSPNGESSYELDPIILNMFQTNTINSSKIFGSTVLRHLNRVNHVKFKSVQEAPFIVLKLPEIPSLLVETAYISNPREEKMLRNIRFQTDIAKALTNSIMEFLPLKPVRPSKAPKVVLTRREDNNILLDNEQRAQSEDVTLTRKSLPQETKLHTVDDAEKTKTETAVYLVRKGDTLEMIASKHDTKISTLLKLNNMKLDDSLHEGRILEVPATQKDITGEKKDKEVQPSTDLVETASNMSTPSVIINEKKKDEKNTAPSVREESSSARHASLVTHYKVKNGDSLDKIAKKHNTTISTLLKLNNMKLKEPLYVGRLVRVSAREKDITGAKRDTETRAVHADVESSSAKGVHAVAVYKVKRGDSLDKIAKKHNTTISTLLKLNNMKLKEPLYVGRLVRIFAREKDITGAKRNTETKAAHTDVGSSYAKGVEEVVVYRVEKGDSLDKIAKKHNTTINTLLKLNDMKLRDALYVGRKLKIPDTGNVKNKENKSAVTKTAKTYIYKVRKGDSLDKIAQRFKITVSEVRRLNKMKRHDVLYVNQKLKLPSNPTL
jgi:N-acetylmuramoyl-L-alanine amidase